MGTPYIGEIRIFAGNFPPVGWMFCEGQLISIAENEALFNLIGTTYGGDGQETFGLPDLRGRIPVHMGTNQGNTFVLGQMSGTETVTLVVNQIPLHTHAALGSGDNGQQSNPANLMPARVTGNDIYGFDTPYVNMANNMIAPVGGSQPHENMQPFLCVSFIISLYGIYPSPS